MLVLILSSCAILNLSILTIFSFLKAKKYSYFFWLGLIILSGDLVITSNIFAYYKNLNPFFYHLNVLLNVSWGGFLLLFYYELKSESVSFLKKILLLSPSVIYAIYIIIFHLLTTEEYRNIYYIEIIEKKTPIVYVVVNNVIMFYSLFVNIFLLLKYFYNYIIKKIKSDYLFFEMFVVLFFLQAVPFIPYIITNDLKFLYIFMPLSSIILFVYLFFRFDYNMLTLIASYSKNDKTETIVLMENNNKMAYQKILEIEKKIVNYMETKQPWKNPEFSLNIISEEISEKQYLVSSVFNNHLNSSFPDYVNSLRLEEVKKELLKSENSNLKIEYIAKQSGFNNKSVFYKYFKEKTGLTPAQWREENKKY